MPRTGLCSRLLAVVAAALLAAACGNDDTGAAEDDIERGTVTVGSVDFDENVIVAAMYAQVLDAAGYDADRRFQLGTREVVLPALEGAELDLVPEYAGTAVEFLDTGATGDTEETVQLLRDLLEDRGLVALEPADAENANALVVTRETAEELDLETASDLADHPDELVLGGPPECPERPLCLPGYEETYGIEFAAFRPLDAGGPVTVSALADGDVDVALLFTTDESIRENDWVVLDDDQDLQPAENIVPVIREEALNDEIEELLNDVSEQLTTEEITELNRRVRIDGADPEDVAADWVAEQGLTE